MNLSLSYKFSDKFEGKFFFTKKFYKQAIYFKFFVLYKKYYLIKS